MEEKKNFTEESSKENFKNLCAEILPQLKRIELLMQKKGIEATAGISVSADGYLNFRVYGSRWEMTRFRGDEAARIRYEYSEEIETPEKTEMEYGKVAENLVEISLAFAGLQAEHEELSDIDSITWKQQFVVWANEFEEKYPEPEHWNNSDYLECIEEYAVQKILEFAHPENKQ